MAGSRQLAVEEGRKSRAIAALLSLGIDVSEADCGRWPSNRPLWTAWGMSSRHLSLTSGIHGTLVMRFSISLFNHAAGPSLWMQIFKSTESYGRPTDSKKKRSTNHVG